MIIRKEEIKDYENIYSVVEKAFSAAEHSDGNEHKLVNALRESDAFIPELSLVAEIDGTVVGHILFTQVKVGDDIELALAPLSVLPAYQRKGIGTALIKEGHKKASELGYNYSIVLGSEAYYQRTGYLPAEIFGIKPPFDVPSENYMAFKLSETAPDIKGTVIYPKEFGSD